MCFFSSSCGEVVRNQRIIDGDCLQYLTNLRLGTVRALQGTGQLEIAGLGVLQCNWAVGARSRHNP